MTAHRGNFNCANAAVADRLASRHTPDELIGTFERLIGRPEGIGKAFPSRLLLGDHVLHHLDIALALRHPPSIPGHIVDAVLDTEVHIPNPFVLAKRNAGGLTLTATDTGWRFATRAGHLVEGEAIYLAAALAGRTCALRALSGDGVPRLQRRIACRTRTLNHRGWRSVRLLLTTVRFAALGGRNSVEYPQVLDQQPARATSSSAVGGRSPHRLPRSNARRGSDPLDRGSSPVH